MHNDKIFLSSQAVELSESKTYIELTNRLCYYDEANLNGVILPFEGSQEKADTLVGMPVVAKYRKDANGNPDFGGHEVYVNPTDGSVVFGTENVGTHLSVEIKDDTVKVGGVLKTLPCLFAKSRIWARNKNVVAAVKRLFDEKKLFTSWEIQSSAYEYKDGLKILKEYVFEANALLGSGHQPAYGESATTLDVASVDPEFVIAEALASDIAERTAHEESDTVKDENIIQVEPEIDTSEQEPVAEDTATETSAMTIQDLHRKLREAVSAKLDGWHYIAWMFPEDHIIWVQGDTTKDELDCIEISYTVDESDAITLGEPKHITLVGTPRVVSEKLLQTSEALIEANETISELAAQVDTLKGYKEVFDQAEAERIAQENEAKKAELSAMLLKGGYIKQEELSENEQIKEIIASLDFDAAKIYLADRMIATSEEKPSVEVASTAAPAVAALMQDEVPEDGVANVRGWLYNRKK